MRGLAKFLIVAFVLYGIYSVRHWITYYQIKKDSLTFVTEELKTISDRWNVEDFKKVADAGLLKSKNIDSAFASYGRLGPLKKPADCAVSDFSTYKYLNVKADYTAVTYECHAEFTHAPATVQLILVRFADNAGWKIYSFDVISPYLSTKGP